MIKELPALVGPSVRFLHIVKRSGIISKETKTLNVFLVIKGQEKTLFFYEMPWDKFTWTRRV